MDVLSDALAAMRTGRPHSTRMLVHAPWGLQFPPSDGAGFHVVLQGTCWLIPREGSPIALGPGDVVFLPHGRGHGLADDPTTPLATIDAEPDRATPIAQIRLAGAGACTAMLCGAYHLSRSRPHPLLADLPDVVHVPGRVGSHPALRAAVDLLANEIESPRPGVDASLSALIDLLLLYLLRAWLDAQANDAVAGWAAALHDPSIAVTLQSIHREPSRAWTVAQLGAQAGLSRAAFARRFSTLIGQPPLTYLTWWRLTLAACLLRESDAPLRAVAERTGYATELALARAFKREYGLAPGAYRRQQSPRHGSLRADGGSFDDHVLTAGDQPPSVAPTTSTGPARR
jgi:AraC-like DNA-binding protein